MSQTDIEKESDYYRYSIENDTLVTPSQKRYFSSEECADAREALKQLIQNPKYNTDLRHSGEMATEFVERHLQYLSRHPLTKHQGYITNLKLMLGAKRV